MRPDLQPEDLLTLGAETLHHLPPARVLALIQALWQQWQLGEQNLTLFHEGAEYVASCRSTHFVVYRRVRGTATPHAASGWPVCLVTANEILDECTPPFPDQDYLACQLSLADWLTLIQQTYVLD